MKTQTLLVDFVKNYGIKEGIIISELCRRTGLAGNAPCCFSVAGCTAIFDYMTEKQIRTALNNLLARGCILRTGFGNTPDRTIRFRVSNTTYITYFDAVTINKLYADIS
jgi:hypothetical protein